jgi:hypothetical protein
MTTHMKLEVRTTKFRADHQFFKTVLQCTVAFMISTGVLWYYYQTELNLNLLGTHGLKVRISCTAGFTSKKPGGAPSTKFTRTSR